MASQSHNYSCVFKFIIIGDTGVGKSCLLHQFTEKKFMADCLVTIGIGLKTHMIEINGEMTNLQLCDSSGQRSFQTVTRSYYKDVTSAFLVYDVTRHSTFNHIRSWLRVVLELTPPNTLIFIIGNKSDIHDQRNVTYEEGKTLADEIGLVFSECSAKTGEGVKKILQNIQDCRDFRTFIENIKSGKINNAKRSFKLCFLEMKDEYEMRPIHYACLYDNIELVKLLIEHKCNIDATNKYEMRPIDYACGFGNIEIVKLLLENKCIINASDNWKRYPIHHACQCGSINLVKLLLSHKCDIDVTDELGNRPIHYLCENNNIELVNLLLQHNCNIDDGYDGLCIITRSQKIIDLLSAAKKNRSMFIVAMSMHLECESGCSHNTCFISSSITKLKDSGHLIGSGSFGSIYKCNGFQRNFATKLIKISPTPLIKKETKKIEENIIEFRDVLRHENIVEYFGSVEESYEMMIFMEYVDGKSLQDQIGERGALPHDKIAKYSKQILLGIAYLHKNKIIHRDVKPANILLDSEDVIKLCDFGVSRSLMTISSMATHDAGTYCGTPNYMAPEVIKDMPYRYAADIWSFGATVVEMLTGYPPFHGINQYALILKISKSKTIEFKPVLPMSESLTLFVNQMLKSEPSHRPSAKALLKHIFFNL